MKKLEKVKKRIMTIICILAGILCFIYFIMLKLSPGKVSFSIFWIVIGCSFLILAILIKYNKLTPRLRPLYIIIGIGMFFFIVMEGIIIYYGTVTDKGHGDYILVLGAGLNKDKVSLSLKYRLDKAIEVYNEDNNIPIVVSGGKGTDETITEALAMKNYLVSKGVNGNMIIMEDKSVNTIENFSFSKSIMEERLGVKDRVKVKVITNSFHMFRASYIGSKSGIKVLKCPCSSRTITSVNFYVREVFAFIKTFLLT